MKTLQLFYLTLLIGAFIAHISCDEWPNEAKIYQFRPNPSYLHSYDKSNVVSVISKVSETVSNILKELGQDPHYVPIDFVENIYTHNVEESLKKVENAMKLTGKSADTTNTKLLEIIDTLANVDSSFQQFPTIAVPILLALPAYVERFLNNNPAIKKSSKVPCNLANTIKMYFKRTLLRRLIHIDIVTDGLGSYQKYGYIHNVTQDPFSENVNSSYDMHPKCNLLKDGKYQAYVDEMRRHSDKEQGYMSHALMKDRLGKSATYYKPDMKNNEYEDKCWLKYFRMVRERLESEFGEAYKKVNNICKEQQKMGTNIPIRTKTGRGLLTITLGAAHVFKGKVTALCDDLTPHHKKNACDLYVIVSTGNITRKTDPQSALGFDSYDATYNFPHLFPNATTYIGLFDKDNIISRDDFIGKNIYGIPQLTHQIHFKHGDYYTMFIISTWQEEMRDSNFKVNVFDPSNE